MHQQSAPRPHMWRMYVQAMVPDATHESHELAAPHPLRRRMRDRRRRLDRVRRLQRLRARPR